MIDVDQLEQRLDLALEDDLRHHLGLDQPVPPAAPRGTPAAAPRFRYRRPSRPHPVASTLPPDRPTRAGDLGPERPLRAEATGSPPGSIESHARRVVELVRLGRIDQADREIRAHADLAEQEGGALNRRDAAAWATMRALLDGRYQDARAGSDAVLALGEAGRDPGAWALHWSQRYWLILESGSDQEKSDLLDLCRQRAYWHDELEWRAALTLLLARLGYADEAGRQLDSVVSRLRRVPRDAAWLDMVTNLAEAAASLGDPSRARTTYDLLAPFFRRTAVVGRALVCKGSPSHQLGLLAAALGRRSDADGHFRDAAVAHRQLGGGSLLAATLAGAATGRASVEAPGQLVSV